MALPDNVPDLLRAAFVATDSSDPRGAPALRVQLAGSNFIRQPAGWDAAWRLAKSNSPTTAAWATFLGDSYTAGSVSSDFVSNSFVGLLKAKLAGAGYTWYGDYWDVTASINFTSGFAGTPPFVFGVSPTWFSWGFGKLPLYSSGTAGSSGSPAITFTTPYACTALDIIHFDFNSGTWQYSVDGGAAQTVTNAGSVNYHKRISITSLANTTHTVTFFNQSGNNVMQVQGVATYANTSAGIGFGRCAFGGASAKSWGFTNAQPSDMARVWQGRGASTTGFGFPTQPALGVIAVGVNDSNNADSVEGYVHNIHRLIRAFRRGYQDAANNEASVLLIAQSNPDGVSSDVTSPINANAKYYDWYLNALESVAQAENCAFVNMHAKWGEHGVALGYQTTNQQHPTDAGHADIAATLAQILV